MIRSVVTELVAVLEAENAALRALDYLGAVGLLARKRAALAALDKAQAGQPEAVADQVAALEPLRISLAEAINENRRLLERAIKVQTTVIATVVSAIRATLVSPPTYGTTLGTRLSLAPALALHSKI